jgi:hypothetical protein
MSQDRHGGNDIDNILVRKEAVRSTAKTHLKSIVAGGTE